MLPNWCMTGRIQSRNCPVVLVLIGWLRCRLEACTGPSTRRSFPSTLTNFARNSPPASSYLEFASLELQRFEGYSKNDRGKLCATFRQSMVILLWPRSGPALARPRAHSRLPSEPAQCLVKAPVLGGSRAVPAWNTPRSQIPPVRGGHLRCNENGGRHLPTPA